MTLVLIHDRAEVAQLQRGRDPVPKEIGADGKEHVTQVTHWWRVYQRNIPEYGNGSAVAASKGGVHKKGAPVPKARPNARPSIPNSGASEQGRRAGMEHARKRPK